MEIKQREFNSISSSQSTRRVVDSAVPAMSLCRSCRVPFLPGSPLFTYHSSTILSWSIFFLALFKVEHRFRCTPAAIRPSFLRALSFENVVKRSGEAILAVTFLEQCGLNSWDSLPSSMVPHRPVSCSYTTIWIISNSLRDTTKCDDSLRIKCIWK